MGHSWNKRRGRDKQRYLTKYFLSNILKYVNLKVKSLFMNPCISGQQFASDFLSRRQNLLLSQEIVLP